MSALIVFYTILMVIICHTMDIVIGMRTCFFFYIPSIHCSVNK